jgi:glycosyltransferase involved in cell wall biosynthesis
MTTPNVSVVIPAFNRREYVQRAIESVFSQTYRDFEIVVVDDGSTDNTGTVLEATSSVRYLFQDHAGPAKARNLGIHHARGEFIAFLDSDDQWEPEHLAMEVEVFGRYPECALVCSQARVENRTEGGGSDDGKILSGDLYAALFQHNFVRTPATMVRKRCLEKLGGFNESYNCFEDYDLWLRIAARYAIARLRRRSVRLGRRADNLSQDSNADRAIILQILEANRDPRRISESIYRTRISNCCLALARYAFANGRRARGWRHLMRAQSLTPFRLRPYRYLVKMLGCEIGRVMFRSGR